MKRALVGLAWRLMQARAREHAFREMQCEAAKRNAVPMSFEMSRLEHRRHVHEMKSIIWVWRGVALLHRTGLRERDLR